MINIDDLLAVPLLLNLTHSIISGIYNNVKLARSGMVIASYKHRVLDREEVITYIVIMVVSVALALRFDPEYLLVILMILLLGVISKYKMGQDIALTETGIMVKGKFEKWTSVDNISINEDDHVDVVLKKKEYEIEGLENVEEFINISQSMSKRRSYYDE